MYLYFSLSYFFILHFNPEYLEYILSYKRKKSSKRRLLRVLWTNMASITKAIHIWAPENWCYRRFLRVSWTARRSSQSILRNQSWIFFGRIDAEAPVLWPPDMKSLFIGKDPTCWERPQSWERLRVRQEGGQRGWVIGWHHWLGGLEFEQTLGDSEGQGSLECCSPWGYK